MSERMTRIELALWVIAGLLTWLLADVGYPYHAEHRVRFHDGWTAIGIGIVGVAFVKWLHDRKQPPDPPNQYIQNINIRGDYDEK